MPARDTLSVEVAAFLSGRQNGATMAEIREAVSRRRRGTPPHSIRSALVRNAGDRGRRLFRRRPPPSGTRGGRYSLRR